MHSFFFIALYKIYKLIIINKAIFIDELLIVVV